MQFFTLYVLKNFISTINASIQHFHFNISINNVYCFSNRTVSFWAKMGHGEDDGFFLQFYKWEYDGDNLFWFISAKKHYKTSGKQANQT